MIEAPQAARHIAFCFQLARSACGYATREYVQCRRRAAARKSIVTARAAARDRCGGGPKAIEQEKLPQQCRAGWFG